MKYLSSILVFLIISLNSSGQENRNIHLLLDQIIEDIASKSDQDLDYSALYETLDYHYKYPININTSDKRELQGLLFLNAFQIEKILLHIKKNGPLLSYHELQSIPGLNIQEIRNLIPFININSRVINKRVLEELQQYVILREELLIQQQKGYLTTNANEKHYLGSPHKSYLKYRLKNRYIQAGITAEKDAGEQFLNTTQRNGFDFYSAHFQIKEIGRIKNLILGDYQLNFGQGIIMQSGIQFGKSSEVIHIQKSGSQLKGHTSSDENIFFRGGAISFQVSKKLNVISFISSNKKDANITDTLNNGALVFSSINGNGFHRTTNELENKNRIREHNFGIHCNFKIEQLNIGASYINTHFDGKSKQNYTVQNQFSNINEDYLENIGLNYQYLYKNMSLFGEIGANINGNLAYLNGLMLSLDKSLSAAFIQRNYSRAYQNSYANAFAESKTQNEKGYYIGVEYLLNEKIKVKSYADYYNFPWLQYNINAPSKGIDYLVQANYTLNKNTILYIRYKQEIKEQEYENLISQNNKKSLRFNINFKEGEKWKFSNRVEYTTNNSIDNSEKGYMLYQNVKYKPQLTDFSFNIRYTLFNCPTYNSRIYAYENDVLYAYSIPAYYGKGKKINLLTHYNFNKNLSFWLKFSHTIYNDKQTIKSGWDEIEGNKLSEIKVQLRYKF